MDPLSTDSVCHYGVSYQSIAPTNCLEEGRVIVEVILDKKYMTRSVPA